MRVPVGEPPPLNIGSEYLALLAVERLRRAVWTRSAARRWRAGTSLAMPATDDGSKAAALAYACRALPIFPTRDKRPLTRHGHLDATCVGPRVAEWWRRWPDASISLRTGRASGIAVLDLDRKGGRDGFLAVPNWRELTPVIALTPSGGRHLFFADEAGRVRCSQDAVGSGVDVRGEGGAVILPPGDGRAWMGPDLLSMLHQLPPWPASVPLFKNSQGPTDKAAAKGPTDTS